LATNHDQVDENKEEVSVDAFKEIELVIEAPVARENLLTSIPEVFVF
jgi:hypothetical protein